MCIDCCLQNNNSSVVVRLVSVLQIEGKHKSCLQFAVELLLIHSYQPRCNSQQTHADHALAMHCPRHQIELEHSCYERVCNTPQWMVKLHSFLQTNKGKTERCRPVKQ